MPHIMHLSEVRSLILMWQLFSPASVIFAGVGVLLSVRIIINFTCATVTHGSLRRLKMSGQAKKLLSTSSSGLKCFSDDSRFTQKRDQPQK